MAISRLAGAALAVSLVCAASGSAVAASIENFAFTASSGGISASGVLEATSNGDGSYSITAATGQVSGFTGAYSSWNGALSLFPDPSAPVATNTPDGAFNYDNLLFLGSASLLDGSGLVLEVGSDPAYLVNLFSNSPSPGYTLAINDDPMNPYNVPGDFSVPEPMSVLTMSAGLIGLISVKRSGNRRRRT